MGLWNSIFKTRSKDWIFASVPPDRNPDALARRVLPPETYYLNIFLRSMRVVNVRQGLSSFYGVVHSYISLPHRDSENGLAEIQTVTKPSVLENVDAKRLDRVIALNHRLMGPVPYRGGDMEIEMGLFSVKTSDLAGPFISVLESMSSVAGVSVLSAAMPFVGPIKDGINLLAGAGDPTMLEIGLSTTFAPAESGYFVVIRAEKSQLDVNGLRVRDDDYRLVDASGNSVRDYPYMVFSVEASRTRDDFSLIPDLRAAHRGIQAAVKKGKVDEAKEAFAVFKRTALTSGDLLIQDAQRLVALVNQEVQSVMETALTGAGTAELPALSTVRLYE